LPAAGDGHHQLLIIAVGQHALVSVGPWLEVGRPRPDVLARAGPTGEFKAGVNERASGSLADGLAWLAAGCDQVAARSFLTDLGHALTC
jgi:hypothetical protein